MNADHHQGLLADFSKPAARKLMHRRFIESQGFRRDDGLWDIEATLTDIKP
ncbi:MAG: DUF2889 domain-containing protein, partial [Betaproteobacteria bacterium]|nr:DUF2889 domain-containing protein [Betaproteobacteria bacterium]